MKFENGRTIEIIKDPSGLHYWWKLGEIGVIKWKANFCVDAWRVYFPDRNVSYWVSECEMRVVG